MRSNPKRDEERDGQIALVASLLPALQQALGPGTELALHDLRKPDRSLVALAGGLTKRKPGAPITGLVLKRLRAGQTDDLFRYPARTNGGKELCSSTIFLRDSAGEAFACLCLETDVSLWSEMARALPALLPEGAEVSEGAGSSEDELVPHVADLAASAVSRAIAKVGVPVELMRKEHRAQVVKNLHASGFFLVQSSVGYVATALGISRFSVYNYLRELGAASATIRPRQEPRRTQAPRPEGRGIRRRAPAATRAAGRAGAGTKGLATNGLATNGPARKGPARKGPVTQGGSHRAR